MLDFSKVMDEVEKFDGTAIILTGEGKAFCSGSDLRNGLTQVIHAVLVIRKNTEVRRRFENGFKRSKSEFGVA